MAETDPEIASLLGVYTPVTDPPGWEERERQSTLNSEKDLQMDKEPAARGIIYRIEGIYVQWNPR